LKRITVEEKQIIYSFKIVIVGGPGVGKTCLFNRFCFNSFNFDTSMTIGLNFHSIDIPIYDPEDLDSNPELLVSNSIFDFGGQERFKPLIPKFLRGADGAILAFDLLNIESLEQLNFWYDQLVKHAKGLDIPKILVGSKNDLISTLVNSKMVSKKLIYEFMKVKNLNGYYPTSALENYNVVEVFKKLNYLMLRKHESKYILG
jgi:small GTP-binding protein